MRTMFSAFPRFDKLSSSPRPHRTSCRTGANDHSRSVDTAAFGSHSFSSRFCF
jgi:hypothetical protein